MEMDRKTIENIAAAWQDVIIQESLAAMAADHYHHHGMGSDMNDDATDSQRAASRKKADQIHAKIKSQHGGAAASAVKSHTNSAFNHDNGQVSSGNMKSDHKSFADKHLGGSGSADHKAYKAKIKSHGYSGDHHK
tara:strand:+ start:87 stop:491 length:405 start_codon:yes stop_codon:yes gene_type:complete